MSEHREQHEHRELTQRREHREHTRRPRHHRCSWPILPQGLRPVRP
jgi:hypothetical protein